MLPLPAPSRERAERLAEPVLYWVARGRATMSIDGFARDVVAGQALLAAAGSRVAVHCSHQGVVVPLPGLTMAGLDRPVRVAIPSTWRPWLLHAFGVALGYLDEPSGREHLQRLLDRAALPPGLLARPRRPTSHELAEVAAAFATAPASSLPRLARESLPGWSSRTLQRRFVLETGLSPRDWSRSMRLALSGELLTEGVELEAVAHAVGYETASGFSRAFRDATGLAPGRWRAQPDASAPQCRPAEAPPTLQLPAARTWRRINGSHVAVWVARGSAVLDVGATSLELLQGDAVIIPAGMPNRIRIRADTLVLPVGFRSGRAEPVGLAVQPAHFTNRDEDDLVQAMVAAYTTVRPRGFDRGAGFTRVRESSIVGPASDETWAISALASALASGELDEPGLARCATWIDVAERELSRLVQTHTGMTFAQWIRLSRMSRARAQLHGGEPASTVSRRLGYAHLPAFSRAFREVHGASPRSIAVEGGEPGRWHRDVKQSVLTNARASAG